MQPDENELNEDGQGWTAERRAELVISILKGEASTQEAARQHGLTASELENWKERFLSGAEDALRSGSGGKQASSQLRGNGRFRLVSKIGRGGMGVVYRAYDEKRRCDVALKTLTDAHRSPTWIRQLKEEFRSLQGIVHPNLVELYDLVANEADCFFTMELLDGSTLKHHLRDGLPPAIEAVTLDVDDAAEAGSRWPKTGAPLGSPLPPERMVKFEDAVAQLVEGVCALHSAGKLHRDIKPSNVQVTSADRLVLLDFGLVSDLVIDRQVSLQKYLAGTTAYVSPEQLRGEPLGFSSDWYAVGVLLYEILTGRVPFHGSLREILALKEAGKPRSLRDLAPETPLRLEELVFRLLDPRPHQRAGPSEVLKALGKPEKRRPRHTSFVGRSEELAALWTALRTAKSGQLTLATIEGRSGMGKTELARRFTSQVQAANEATVLSGRCLPEELVPYRALDGVVDQLATYLGSLPAPEVPRLEPGMGANLCRLFGALADVPGLEAPRGQVASELVEPRELRRLGVEALRQLLGECARRQPLVIWIDDFQWTDPDSEQLILHLLRPAQAPILYLLAYRAEDVSGQAFLSALREGRLAVTPPIPVHVEPLSDASAHEVVSGLLGGAVDDELLNSLVVESCGSPFFLGELARHAAHNLGRQTNRAGLADVVDQRIAELTDTARRIVELVSVAGRPMGRETVLAAANLSDAAQTDISRLAHARMLRLIEQPDAPLVEVYHDKMRDAVLAQLSTERLRKYHHELAVCLRSLPSADDEQLAVHYRGAGDTELAGEFALRAAHSAREKLAFDRAGALYEQVLELLPGKANEAELHELAATAWADAGKGARAARHFEQAAELAEKDGTTKASPRTLLRLASEHYLRSGRLADGMRLLRLSTANLPIPVPETRIGAVLSGLLPRLGLMLKPLSFPVSEHPTVDASALDRLDSLWSASTSISMLNYVAADPLGVHHLRGAIQARDRSRVIRGLGYEAAFETVLGYPPLRRHAQKLLLRMEEEIGKSSIPYDRAWGTMAQGISAWFNAEWKRAVQLCDEAAEIYRLRCRGVAWELAITDAYAMPALAYLGDLPELQKRVPRALASAMERGDFFNANTCRLGMPNLIWLVIDQPLRALSEADAALSALFGNIDVRSARMMGPLQPSLYLTPHYHHLFAAAQADLYRGDAWSALRRVEAAWAQLRSAFFLRARVVRSEAQHLRGRVALAAANSAARGEIGHVAPKQLLAIARSAVGQLEREDLQLSIGFACALRAGVARLDDDEAAGKRHLEAAAAAFDLAGMALYAAASRAAAQPGAEATEHAKLTSLGVKSPPRLLRMLIPN